MITASFTSFVIPGSDIFLTTLSVAVVLISCQTILHPIWAGVGQLIAKTIQGTRAERGVFVILALITLITVFYALFGGLI